MLAACSEQLCLQRVLSASVLQASATGLLPTRVSPSRSEHDVCVLLQTLVHVLAALALMGLGCLWLLMNLSAEFAHAKRDMRELPGRSPTTLTQVRQAGGNGCSSLVCQGA